MTERPPTKDEALHYALDALESCASQLACVATFIGVGVVTRERSAELLDSSVRLADASMALAVKLRTLDELRWGGQGRSTAADGLF